MLPNKLKVGLATAFVVLILVVAGAVRAEAQQPKKVPRIGFMSGSGDANNPEPLFEAFRQGLRDLGYVEHKNLLIEGRYAEGRLDRIPALVNELLEQKLDVFVTESNVAIRAAKKTTKTIPIVMVSSIDPVA